MTVVYLDLVFLLNGVINYLLLLATGRLMGRVLMRWRIAVSGILGGVYAVLTFLPAFASLAGLQWVVLMAWLMVWIAYGGQSGVLRTLLVFCALASGLAGGILAVGLIGGRSGGTGNVIYQSVDVPAMLLSASVCYFLVSVVFERALKHQRHEMIPVHMKMNRHEVIITALQDTGNTLCDPVTGLAVLVIEGMRLKQLVPEIELLELQQPVKAMEQLAVWGQSKGYRLLPYQAVGIECGMLLAVWVDEVKVGNEKASRRLVALSPNSLSDGGNYQALIGVS